MERGRRPIRPTATPPETSAEALIACSSPPCFLHELDPTYLSYLGRAEVAALLRDLLTAEQPGTFLEMAWLRGMLRRHLASLGEAPEPGAPAAGPQEGLLCRLREALPRLHDERLRGDLTDLLAILEHGAQQRSSRGLA